MTKSQIVDLISLMLVCSAQTEKSINTYEFTELQAKLIRSVDEEDAMAPLESDYSSADLRIIGRQHQAITKLQEERQKLCEALIDLVDFIERRFGLEQTIRTPCGRAKALLEKIQQ